jgi:hypothetical protein
VPCPRRASLFRAVAPVLDSACAIAAVYVDLGAAEHAHAQYPHVLDSLRAPEDDSGSADIVGTVRAMLRLCLRTLRAPRTRIVGQHRPFLRLAVFAPVL